MHLPGLEPGTPRVRAECSAYDELEVHGLEGKTGLEPAISGVKVRCLSQLGHFPIGGRARDQTGDLLHVKQALYRTELRDRWCPQPDSNRQDDRRFRLPALPFRHAGVNGTGRGIRTPVFLCVKET